MPAKLSGNFAVESVPVLDAYGVQMRVRMQTHRIPRNFLVYGKAGSGSIASRDAAAFPNMAPSRACEPGPGEQNHALTGSSGH